MADRAQMQHQRTMRNRAAQNTPSTYDKKWARELRKEDKDLWKQAKELGMFGGGDRSWSDYRGGGKGTKQKLWESAAQSMNMGNLDDTDELKKLLKTYEKSGIKNFDSMNDVSDFKKAHEKEQFTKMYMDRAGSDFQELWSNFAEQAGIETPEGGWKMPDTWGQKPKASRGITPSPNDPRHDAAPNTIENRGGEEHVARGPGFGTSPNSGWQGIGSGRTPDGGWYSGYPAYPGGNEGADAWGRRGEDNPAYGRGGYGPSQGWDQVPYVRGAEGYQSPYLSPSAQAAMNSPLAKWHMNFGSF